MKNLFLVCLTLGLITAYNIDKKEEQKKIPTQVIAEDADTIVLKRSPASSKKDDDKIDAFPQWKSKEGYKFIYYFEGTRLEIEKPGSSTAAFSAAAKECFAHFTKGKDYDEERGLDVIDVCANPRTK